MNNIGYHISLSLLNDLFDYDSLPDSFQIMPFGYELFGKISPILFDKLSRISNLSGKQILMHLPYTITMKPDLTKGDIYVESLKHYIGLCKQFGFYGLVLHVTSVGEKSIIIDFLNKINKDDRHLILLENMPHKSSFSLEQINTIAKTVGCGVCLDTAHWFSTNHPVFEISELKAIHFNSVFYDRGSHKDLHGNRFLLDDSDEHIKQLKQLVSLQNYEKLKHIPIVTEIHWDDKNTNRRLDELSKISEIINSSFNK